jgi:hypothetical protein
LLALFGAASVVAANGDGTTYMYSKGVRIGHISLNSTNFWGVECGGYEGAHVEAARRRLTVFTALDDVLGYAYPERAGRWRIVGESLDGRSIKGLAVAANSTRWNIWRGTQKVGYTVGPNGPAAAAGFLFVCG